MTAFAHDYYKFMLMNENTLISPVLGIYTINLSGNSDQIDPINFILIKSVIPSNINNTKKMQTMIFDLKGSTYGRRSIKDYSLLPSLHNLEHKILTAPLKDLDFNDGLKSLRLSETHPEETKALLYQISLDTSLFAKHNLMDYSLLIYIQYDKTKKRQLPNAKFPYSFVQNNIEVEIDGQKHTLNRYI
jgi:hypothetical protein